MKFETKDFDKIEILKQENTEIEHGTIFGDSTIVFIKVGLQGSIYGYENKYLKLAKNLHAKHGCTVIVSSNPNGCFCNFENEMKSIKAYADYQKFESYQIYYMGCSNGASLGIINAHKYPEIKKLVCINGPLMIDTHLLISGIKNFSGEKMNLVYGSKDPSINMIKLFAQLETNKIQITKVTGADHHFTGCLNLFQSLPGFYFFGDEMGKGKDYG